MITSIQLRLDPVAKNIVGQLKGSVPVWTGRLKNSIKYTIQRKGDDYLIFITMEDYFVWLKNRTKTPRLPSPRQLALARPPLPKMNNLRNITFNDLSPRAKGILQSVDMEAAFKELDLSELEKELRKVLVYDI